MGGWGETLLPELTTGELLDDWLSNSTTLGERLLPGARLVDERLDDLSRRFFPPGALSVKKLNKQALKICFIFITKCS